MHDVDFLPSEYREQHERRRWYDRRILVVTGVAAIIAVLAWSQRHRARQLQADLAIRRPACAATAKIKEALDELQSQLQLARSDADLLTYLRHPWPRTRILAALLGPLPDSVRFEELQIACEAPAEAQSARLRSPAAQEDEEGQMAALAPAARDLKRLRQQCDRQQTVVTLTAITDDSVALHEYVGALGRDDLFAKAHLQSSKIDRSDAGSIRFRVTLVVRPGYGQPGGPCGADPRGPRENRSEDHLARR